MNLKPFQQWGQGGYVCLKSCLPIQLKSWQAHCHPTAKEKNKTKKKPTSSTDLNICWSGCVCFLNNLLTSETQSNTFCSFSWVSRLTASNSFSPLSSQSCKRDFSESVIAVSQTKSGQSSTSCLSSGLLLTDVDSMCVLRCSYLKFKKGPQTE